MFISSKSNKLSSGLVLMNTISCCKMCFLHVVCIWCSIPCAVVSGVDMLLLMSLGELNKSWNASSLDKSNIQIWDVPILPLYHFVHVLFCCLIFLTNPGEKCVELALPKRSKAQTRRPIQRSWQRLFPMLRWTSYLVLYGKPNGYLIYKSTSRYFYCTFLSYFLRDSLQQKHLQIVNTAINTWSVWDLQNWWPAPFYGPKVRSCSAPSLEGNLICVGAECWYWFWRF